MPKTYLLHDCDTGSDDAVALMMLLGQSDVIPVALTCVEGNTKLSNVVMNNLRLLKLYNMLDKVSTYILICKSLGNEIASKPLDLLSQTVICIVYRYM